MGSQKWWVIWKYIGVAGVGAILVFTALWALANFAGDKPGDLGYSIKRAKESISLSLAFGEDAKARLRFNYARERIGEASLVAKGTYAKTSDKQIKDSEVIQSLVNEFTQTVNEDSSRYGQLIDQGVKLTPESGLEIESDMVDAYAELYTLRLLAPSDTQASILRSLVSLQIGLATTQDALGAAPITKQDGEQLTGLVSRGFLTQEELINLLSTATSNRQLLIDMRDLVRNGQIPSTTLHAINYDIFERINPEKQQLILAQATFDDMARVAIFNQVIAPSAAQKKQIEAYLSSYKVGQLLPRDESRTLLTPLVYGLTRSSSLTTDVSKIDADKLSPANRVTYDFWLSLATAQQKPDPQILYEQILAQPDSLSQNISNFRRAQLEILSALRANVAYMTLPAGWTDKDVVAIQGSFAQRLADLEALLATEIKAKELAESMKEVSGPIAAPLTDDEVEKVRQLLYAATTVTQTQVITDASQNKTPNTNQAADDLQKQFNELLATLDTKANPQINEQVSVLQKTSDETIANLKGAQSALDAYIGANTSAHDNLKQTITSLSTDQAKESAQLQQQLNTITQSGQAGDSGLALSIQTLQTSITQNLASVQERTGEVESVQAQARADLLLHSVAQFDQIAQIQSKLNSLDQSKTETKADVEGLKAAILTLQTSQAAITDLVNGQISALDLRLRQSVEGLQLAQQRTNLDVAGLSADLASANASIQNLIGIQATAQAELIAQASAISTVRTQLDQSVTSLQQSQTNTQQEVDLLKTGTAQIQQSVTAINQQQTAAQAQINQLVTASAVWATIPENLQYNQQQFEQYEATLSADFAAKSAALQAQFEAYQAQLNQNLNTLRTDVNYQDQLLQQQIDALKKPHKP